MSLTMNLIMLGCTYPIIILGYFLAKLDTGDKKTTLLGISIPDEFRHTPQVQRICSAFQKSLRRWFAAAIVFPVLFAWVPYMTFYMAGYMLWIFFFCTALFIPFARYGERLKQLKRTEGWAGQPGIEKVDFAIAAEPIQMIKPQAAAVFLLLSLLPPLWELTRKESAGIKAGNVVLLVSMAAVVWIMTAVMLWIDRQKSELISADSEVNASFNRSKKSCAPSAGSGSPASAICSSTSRLCAFTTSLAECSGIWYGLSYIPSFSVLPGDANGRFYACAEG